jgi:transcription initiation factor TFIIIB Brf1 subunit/transcription initiation factor TFIIB
MEPELTIDQILEGLGVPEEQHELAKQLLAAQREYREQLGREPNRRERRAFEAKMRRAMRRKK